MAENNVLLETIQLTQTAASVTFDNIPQTGYTDLKVVVSSRSNGPENSGGAYCLITFNGSGANGSSRLLGGDGSSPYSSSNASGIAMRVNPGDVTANVFGNAEMVIPNYTSSTAKSISIDHLWEANQAFARVELTAGLWNNSSAITSITFTPGAGSFVANSTFSLYGVADVNTTPAIAPLATGGNMVSNDGTYWIHTFLTSGTFTPQTELSCDYLVVAGGGGGGYAPQGGGAGGGGAGGLRSTVTSTGGGGTLESAISLNNGTAYTITVGAGGLNGSNTYPTNGNNSSISGNGITTITAIGGGASAISGSINAVSGGSGGGGAYQSTGGSGTANQGYAGGNGSPSDSPFPAGGGGGANAVGGNASGSSAGNGGAGVAVSITGSSVTYAGGGGGGGRSGVTPGSGGAGGGGAGGVSSATSGTANTGGGGGGSSDTNISGNGGSGIVIIRYAMV